MSTILIVDDEQPVRDILAMLLQDGGHRVLLASHGRGGLELAERECPDLIISDVMMPLLNGAELCRRLKQNVKTSAIPIILMSSAGWRLARETGADAFIDKPFEIDAIDALIHHWLAQSSHAAPPSKGMPKD